MSQLDLIIYMVHGNIKFCYAKFKINSKELAIGFQLLKFELFEHLKCLKILQTIQPYFHTLITSKSRLANQLPLYHMQSLYSTGAQNYYAGSVLLNY